MRTTLSIALAACMVSAVFAQQESSLNPLERASRLLSTFDGVEIGAATGKCGTPLVFEMSRQLQGLPAQKRDQIRNLLQRPQPQKSRLSPSSRFRIHYDTTGIHKPAMLSGGSPVPNSHEEYVDSVASVLDQVWNQEIGSLGFGQPPSDGGNGGGLEYDVYLQDFSNGTFGYTEWTGEIQVETGDRDRFASFIVMENDFYGYRTPGIAGLKVTSAHEFHHAIQIGSYGIWNTVANSDFYFYELTSTWMEDAVFTDVNDYLFDLPQFFQQYKSVMGVSYPFTEYSPLQAPFRAGYERAVWGHFLARRFGANIMRQIWEEMRLRPALRAQNVVLQRQGSSLASAFAEFTIWNFYTADRADTVRYYPEGRRYPRFDPNVFLNYVGGVSAVNSSAPPLSCQHCQFAVTGDTLTAIVANTDFEGAYANSSARPAFAITLGSPDPPGGKQHLANGFTMGFKVDNYDSWRTMYLGSLTREDLKANLQPFPNPFRLSRSDALHLPVEDGTATAADVYVLSSTLDLSFSGRYPITDFFGTRMVSVPASELKTRVFSGIHFVILRTPEKESRWKVAIVQ